jgi:hypothetical protein
MYDDLEFRDLVQRLRREAETVSAHRAPCGVAAAIGVEFHRRRARRRRRGGLAAALLVVCGWFGYAAWRHVGVEAPQALRVVQTPSAVSSAGSSSRKEDQVALTPPTAPPTHELPVSPGDGSAAPAPFLITVTGEDEQEVIAVGVYLPPRVQRVNLRDLPPLEQAAVRRVLGLDEPTEKPTI